MKSLLFLFLLYPAYTYAQNKEHLSCDLLQKALENDVFQSDFFRGNDTSKELIVIDKDSIFQNCQLLPVCGKRICLSNILPSSITPAHHLPKEWQNRNRIVIFIQFDDTLNKPKKIVEKNIYTIGFWQPWTNEVITLELWTDKSEKIIKTIVKSRGAY